MQRRLLSIYLNDHAALGVAGIELAQRAASGSAGTPFGDHAASLARELESHRDALARLMAALGIRSNPLKQRGAWLGEKLGRAKLNGRLTSPSPLSPLVEAEGLLACVGSFAVLWRGLADLGDDAVDGAVDSAALAAAAADQLSALERRRLDLVAPAIAP